MNGTETSKPRKTHSVWYCVWSPALAAVLALLVVQPIPLAASSHLQDDNHIVLPADGRVVVNFVSTSTNCTGDFGLVSPQDMLIYPDYRYYAGFPFALPGSFTGGTELVFYIMPRDFCSGPYFSTDPNRAHITHPNSKTWIIAWEDWVDADFNDLIVQIDLQPGVVPFLDLPYDYSGSTFADESKDTEQGGKVNAYFDHQYPTYSSAPNTPDFPNTVNFRGYDSDQTDPPPPYNVAYNGHDGIDYYVSKNTPVLSAVTGTVIFAGWDPDNSCAGRKVAVRHDNGYVTEYWHLSSIPSDIVSGTQVTRDPSRPIGYVGSTGDCSTGEHLHLRVTNPWSIVVDPYGWKPPQQDAAWYGRSDPWQQYNFEQGNPDATSHYLWVDSLEVVRLVAPSASTVITSTSGHVVATVPAGAYAAPLRIELAETLQSAHIPGYRSLRTFSLVGYTSDDIPIVMLEGEVTLDVHMPTGGTNTLAIDAMPPMLQVWNAQASMWRELPTSWDPLTGTARATTSQIGTFALSVRNYPIYLPVVTKRIY